MSSHPTRLEHIAGGGVTHSAPTSIETRLVAASTTTVISDPTASTARGRSSAVGSGWLDRATFAAARDGSAASKPGREGPDMRVAVMGAAVEEESDNAQRKTQRGLWKAMEASI